MADIPRHHLVYGILEDFLTGEPLVDTDDERYRQRLARLLVEGKGYQRSEVLARLKIETLFNHRFVTSKIDFVIRTQGKKVLVLRYGPGSLVTRERPAVAAARVLVPDYQIPLTVVTNGEDAELLDTLTAKVIAAGLDAIPSREGIIAQLDSLAFIPLPASRRERELRVLNAYDIEVCCAGAPCPLPDAPQG